MMKHAIPLLILIFMLAGAIYADRPLPRAEFTFINRGGVTTLDLQMMSWQQDLRIARALFEGLTSLDVDSPEYTPIPAIAERWDISPDGRTYTFQLRDARWSNGDPVTTDDFLHAWRRALLPEVGADFSGMVMLIKGGESFFTWRAGALQDFAAARAAGTLDTIAPGFPGATPAERLWNQTVARFSDPELGVRARAINSRTLVVELERPTPYFLDVLAFPCLFPHHAATLRSFESLDPETGALRTDHEHTKPPNLVSNGPFVLTRWRFKRDLRLDKNPHYWNAPAIAINSIDVPNVDDENAAVLAFKTGAVDWVTDVVATYKAEIYARKRDFYDEHRDEVASLRAQGLGPIEIDRRLPHDERAHIHVLPAFGTYFWNFNCMPRLRDGRENPFADARVRRAFAMVVDKKLIADEVRRLNEPVSRTLIPPGSIAGYDAPRGLDDIGSAESAQERRVIIDRARQLLADAGYPDPSKFMTVDLLFTRDGGHDLIAQILAKNWREHLGVPVSLTVMEIKVFRDKLKNQDYVTARGSWFGDYGDPTTFLDLNRSTDANNDRKFASSRYDALLDQARDETDSARRMELLEEAERLLMEEELPLIPIFQYNTVYMFDAREIRGINDHPRDIQLLGRFKLLEPRN
ncbi:MAG: peptide ABC transporter substrate-binding protein [Planctomycetota bacterium]|nr:peptide ABC transporter substrate-binding protein [Planctomycetota bacterium]